MNEEYEPIETLVIKQEYDDNSVIHRAETVTCEAAYAMAMIERWGLVMGATDGEDSAGRQQLKLMTVDELVTRAFDVSIAAFTMARERGLMVSTPLPLREVDTDCEDKEEVA